MNRPRKPGTPHKGWKKAAAMTTQRERWEAWTAPETLEENVRLFFEIMDTKEYSDMSDREFHPTRFNAEERCIHSCRVWDTHRLNKVMERMKELTNGVSSNVQEPLPVA